MRDRDVALIRRTALVIILIVTAIPSGFRRPIIEHPQWKLFKVDFILNVVLYVPFGFGVGNRTLGAAISQGAILSTVIEALQMFYRGRSATILDVVANSAGAGIGTLLFRLTQRWTLPERIGSGNRRKI
jgi:glycopeptide antibiotics resistance protein